MLKCTDEEDTDPSMSLDMTKFLNFCCENGFTLEFYDKANIIIKKADIPLLNFYFSDFFYPKNLMRTLKEKLENDDKRSHL